MVKTWSLTSSGYRDVTLRQTDGQTEKLSYAL